MQPSPGRDAVSHISKFVGSKDCDEILEDGGLDKVGVQFSDAVDLVRTNQGQVSHANHFWLPQVLASGPSSHVERIRQKEMNKVAR